MERRALISLEFNKITEILSSLAVSDLGKKLCNNIEISADIDEIEINQQETSEALYIIENRGIYPISHSSDISPYLQHVAKGGNLSMKALLEIADFLQACSNAKRLLSVNQEKTDRISKQADLLATFPHIYQDIKQSILSEEEISDHASADLFHIRKNIRACNDKIKDKLQSFIRQSSYASYLQDPIITVRNGRYVLPVKQENRQQIPGLVHDQSASGATIFVEPLSVVEAGNELRQWLFKEEQEIERILCAFSAQIAAIAEHINDNICILSHLDFVFAKARLAKMMRASRPKLNTKGYVKFIKVRHPLLDKNTVVPCDLHLGDKFTSLVITGPNTGGKTVTLKTIGLISLMAQAGLHVPGEENCELAVFTNIFSDIGDEQSIEQSLSTFSSHMTNIINIIKNAKKNDLVLLDELGAGTDPTEGAALAQAILNHFLKHNIMTVATTHYSELKAYAISTDGVENASVEFNVKTLKPSYKLLIGMPGKSNAFEISRRLGLEENLIMDAQKLISKESRRFEEVLAQTEQQLQIVNDEKTEILKLKADALNAKIETDRLLHEAQAKYDSIIEKAKKEAKKSVEKHKREIHLILDELKNVKNSNLTKPHELSELKTRLSSADSIFNESSRTLSPRNLPDKDKIKVGDVLLLRDNNLKVVVLSKPDNKNELMIQAGAVKMKVQLAKLDFTKPETKTLKTKIFSKTESIGHSVAMECDVRGFSLDDAILAVDKYLDMAVMNSLHEVSIIHGKGTGTLRSGLQKHLKTNQHVRSFRIGLYGEGEAGVTIVSLK